MFGNPTCGSEAGCFVMFSGEVWHDSNWHRLQDIEAENWRLRDALSRIRDDHAQPDQPGASCAEGCGGRWPCSTWAEANHILGPDS